MSGVPASMTRFNIHPLPSGAVARNFGVDPVTVYAIRKNGPESFKNSLTMEHKEYISALVAEEPGVAAHQIVSSLFQKFGTTISVSTVNKHLRSINLKDLVNTRFAVKQPENRKTERNGDAIKHLRVAFVKKYAEMTSDIEALFIDEISFTLSEFGEGRIKRSVFYANFPLVALTATMKNFGVFYAVFLDKSVSAAVLCQFLAEVADFLKNRGLGKRLLIMEESSFLFTSTVDFTLLYYYCSGGQQHRYANYDLRSA